MFLGVFFAKSTFYLPQGILQDQHFFGILSTPGLNNTCANAGYLFLTLTSDTTCDDAGESKAIKTSTSEDIAPNHGERRADAIIFDF